MHFLDTLSSASKSKSIKPQKIHYQSIIEDLVNTFKKEVQKEFHFKQSLDLKVKEVYWDPAIIREIFQNIISNSIKYSKKNNSCLEIKSTKLKNTILFEFTDNGQGMTQKNAQKIFNIFTQVDDTKQGHGVGLMFCHEMIKMHSGKIWLETKKDVGTTFYVQLPIQTNI